MAMSMHDGRFWARSTFMAMVLLALCRQPAVADPAPAPSRVERVVVLDEGYAVVGQLASSRDLLDFNDFWQAKLLQPPTTPPPDLKTFTLKLDIKAASGGGRWLYRTDGMLLSQAAPGTAVFKVPNPAAFNELLGVKR